MDMKMEENAILFRTLIGKIAALTPLCIFTVPEALAADKELFFRRQYKRLNVDMTKLVKGGVI
jgi:hypothetical protein